MWTPPLDNSVQFLHAGRIVRPELTCQFSAYNSIVLFLFLAAWRNSDTPTSVGLLTVIPAACRCFATSQQCLNLVVAVSQSINHHIRQKNHIFIARQHTDARYWYSKSVRPSVRYVPVPDENGLTYSHSFFHHTTFTNHTSFTSIKHLHGIPAGSPCGGAKCRWGIKTSRFFLTNNRYISQTIQDIAIVTMEGE